MGGRVPNHCYIRSVVKLREESIRTLNQSNKLPTTYDRECAL
ncbi:MAG: hypothetical protein ACTS4X_02010 [Candidatus Hodgkinia cicadicola]